MIIKIIKIKLIKNSMKITKTIIFLDESPENFTKKATESLFKKLKLKINL